MKVTNIDWDINREQIEEELMDLTFRELIDRICDLIHHNVIDTTDIVDLPIKLEVPADVGIDEEDIANWLTQEYGYCVRNFSTL